MRVCRNFRFLSKDVEIGKKSRLTGLARLTRVASLVRLVRLGSIAKLASLVRLASFGGSASAHFGNHMKCCD